MVFLDWRFSRLDSAWRMFCSRHSDLPMTPWPREYGLFPLSHKGREKNSGARNISVRQTREAQYFTGGSTWNNWDALTMDSVHPSFFFCSFVLFLFSPRPYFFFPTPFFSISTRRDRKVNRYVKWRAIFVTVPRRFYL